MVQKQQGDKGVKNKDYPAALKAYEKALDVIRLNDSLKVSDSGLDLEIRTRSNIALAKSS